MKFEDFIQFPNSCKIMVELPHSVENSLQVFIFLVNLKHEVLYRQNLSMKFKIFQQFSDFQRTTKLHLKFFSFEEYTLEISTIISNLQVFLNILKFSSSLEDSLQVLMILVNVKNFRQFSVVLKVVILYFGVFAPHIEAAGEVQGYFLWFLGFLRITIGVSFLSKNLLSVQKLFVLHMNFVWKLHIRVPR